MTTVFDPNQTPLASLSYQNIPNILDNGGFEIWQRGTVFNGIGNAGYTADRWKNSYAGSPTVNMTQESSTVHDGVFSMKVVVVSAAGAIWGMGQSIENYQSYRGKTLTFTCWLNTNMANVNIVLYDGITLTSSAFHTGNSTWQQLSVTATMSASASNLVVFVTQETTGVTGTLYVDSAMLVIGSTVVPFSPTNPEVDLSRCQRFYEIGGGSNEVRTLTMIRDATQNHFFYYGQFSVTKRVNPTMTVTPAQIIMVQNAALGIATSGADTANWTMVNDGVDTQVFNYVGNRAQTATYSDVNVQISWTASADF